MSAWIQGQGFQLVEISGFWVQDLGSGRRVQSVDVVPGIPMP